MKVGSKSLDFVAAIITGSGVWPLSTSGIPSFLRPNMLSVITVDALIKVGCFALAALVVALWRNQLRARLG